MFSADLEIGLELEHLLVHESWTFRMHKLKLFGADIAPCQKPLCLGEVGEGWGVDCIVTAFLSTADVGGEVTIVQLFGCELLNKSLCRVLCGFWVVGATDKQLIDIAVFLGGIKAPSARLVQSGFGSAFMRDLPADFENEIANGVFSPSMK